MNTDRLHDYDDIITLPHHVSSRHPHMTMSNRAAQFSPFAALTGYGDTIRETARLTDQKPELSESERAELDYRLQAILALSGTSVLSITYFVPDQKKDGGALRTVRGQIRRIDDCCRKIILQDQTQIDMDCILDISVCE